MSKVYELAGRGSFFHENPENEKHPAFKGKAEILGRDFDLAFWRRTSKGGHRYLFMSVALDGQRDTVGDGALFERQNSNPKAPSLTGPVEISERKFEASVWPQKSEAGNEHFRIKFETVTESE